MNPKNYSTSFKILLFSQLFFIAAYITLRESLALYLYHKGIPLNQCYGITTSAVSLFAVCSILWGIFFKYLPTHRVILQIALALNIIAFILINAPLYPLKILAITLYIVSGSLYTLTIALLVNAHFGENHDRCQGNQAYQVILNIGALFGILGIALSPIGEYAHLYYASMIILVGTMILYFVTAKKIMYIEKPEQKHWVLPVLLAILVAGAFVLLTHPQITRDIMILAFLVSVTVILKMAIKESQKSYILFLLLVIFSNGVFWMANAIFNIQFPIFLSQDVTNTIFNIHLSPLFVLVTDPLASIVFGGLLYLFFINHDLNRFGMLTFAQAIIFISMVILAFSLWHTQEQVALFWPLLTRSVFAIGEFIIVTTLRAQVAELIQESERQGFFMGMLRLSQAFSATMAFYISSALTKASADLPTRLSYDFSLYAFMAIVTFVAFTVLTFLWLYQKRT